MHHYLISKDINSIMFVPMDNKENDKDYETDVIQAKCFNKTDRYFYLKKQRKILNSIKKQIEKNRPDVLHAHFAFSSGYVSLKAKQKYNIPYIVAVQNTDVNVFFKYMIHLRKLGIQILLNAEKVIFINPSYRDLIVNRYIPTQYRRMIMNKSIILPFGIDEFWLTNTIREKREINDQKLHIITVGVINKNKNQITVAKAVELLKAKGYQIDYTIIGKIKNKKIFQKLIKYNFVNYVESKSKEELIMYYRYADILVLPSIHETFGLVYAEAMSQGLPVIYSKGQGFDMQFEDGEVGYSVDCFDANDISNKICAIKANYDEISNRCLDNCNKFDWKSILDKYINIYDGIKNQAYAGT